MKRNTTCKLVELLHPLTMHLAGNFSNYLLSLSQPFPQKQVNMRTTASSESSCSHRVLELTSHPALDPCPVKLGREPK